MTIKKIVALSLAMVMAAAALAGCNGKGTTGGDSENTGTVDIDKIDGVVLHSDTDAEETHAVIGDVEVSIGDAKVIEFDGMDVAIVEYTFKNNGDAEANFAGVVRAEGYQDDMTLTPTVVYDVDGVDMLTISQNIEKGHQISVQKAYRLMNKEDILEIEVTEITSGSEVPQSIVKYYSFSE